MSNLGRRPIAQRNTGWARMLAKLVAKLGIWPNQISVFSVACAAMAATCLIRADSQWREGYGLAALFILLRLLCNMIDGMVAVEGGMQSKSGEIYNELPDRFSDMLTLLGAAWACDLMQLGWAAALFAVLTAYVRTLAAGAGAPPDFGGPMAKQQRMFLLIFACLCCAAVPPLAAPFLGTALVVILLGSAITTARRAFGAIRALEQGE